MKKFCFLIACFILFYPSWSYASKDIDGARKFMIEFLEMEYIGNPFFRVDNVMYSQERKSWVDKKYSDTNAELNRWDGDQLCVVDSYEIKEIKIINQRAIIEVVFKEFAHTDGKKGYGDSPLIRTEKNNKETYHLRYKNERWWIYDPPIPRVSRKALIEHNNDIIKLMKDWINEEGSNVQKKYYHNLINTNDMLKGN